MTDAELYDAQEAAKRLMADAAGNAVLREAVEDWKREAARLKARVEELEGMLQTGVELWDGKWHGDEFWRRRAYWLNSVCAVLRKERP